MCAQSFEGFPLALVVWRLTPDRPPFAPGCGVAKPSSIPMVPQVPDRPAYNVGPSAERQTVRRLHLVALSCLRAPLPLWSGKR